MELSPFETDLEDSERGHTERNLQRLKQQPAPSGPLRVAVFSDSHSGYDEFAELIELVNARDDIAFVLHLGDMTDLGLRQGFRWALEQLEQLDVPFFTVIGNHDALSNGVDIYRDMFGAYNYTLDYEGVRVVLMNTNAVEFPEVVPSAAWVKRATTPSARIKSVIVAAHQEPIDPELREVLADSRVAALVVGHIHSVKCYSLCGVPAFRVGIVPERNWAVLSVDRVTGVITMQTCTGSTCMAIEP